MKHERNPFHQSFENLEALADKISEVLRNPVTIEDDNHRLIAYSSHESHSDEARVATIIGRRVPEKVIRALWQEGHMHHLLGSEEALAIPSITSVGLGKRIAIAIRKQRTVLGYIWVLESDRPLADDATDMLKKAAHAASAKLLQLQVKKRKEEKGHEDFFWQLLTGHLENQGDIEDKAADLGIALPGRYRIVVLEFASVLQDKQQHIEYMLTTSQRITAFFHTVKQKQLIILSALKPDSHVKEDDFEDFQYIFDQMQQRFGFSPSGGASGSPYDDYMLVERSYQEALTVLRMKRLFPKELLDVYTYSQLGYYRLLPAMMTESRLHPVVSSSVKKLRLYDNEHNSDLLHTLEVFLATDSNVKSAAETLHIHINTLSYRLKRIGEIGGIDLGNTDQKITVFLDLKLDRLKKEQAKRL